MLTCFQISDTENKGGINILNGVEVVSHVCKEEPFKTHRPSAFRYDNSTATLGCGWDTTSLGLRMSTSLFTVVVAILSIYLTVVRKSKIAYVFAILLFICAAGFGWFTYSDSDLIADSQKWCDANLTGANFTVKPETVTCDYGQFIFIAVLDALSAAAWLGLTVFTVLVKADLPDFLTKSEEGADKKKKKKGPLKKPLVEVASEEGEAQGGNADYIFPESPADDDGNDFEESDGKKKKKGKWGKKDKKERIDDGAVDFDEQSNMRFPPMSKTTAKQLAEDPKSSSSSSSKAKDGDFDFSQVDSGADSGSNRGGSYQQKPQQQQQQSAPPPPRPQQQKPAAAAAAPAPLAQSKSNDYFDFESYVPDDK